jgi:inner membrane protein
LGHRVGVAGLEESAVHSLCFLDTLTDGGRGIAVLWPMSNERFFAPWRPIPVSPLGRAVLSEWGRAVIWAELRLFWPFLLYAFWPRRWLPKS